MNERNERDEPLDERLLEALRELPREREPGELLEERTVRVLRAQGVLASHRSGFRWSWVIASTAASIALFACGVVTGQWLNGRQTIAVLAAQQSTLPEAALLVEQTGNAYVTALSQLAEKNAVPGSTETAEARETAL